LDGGGEVDDVIGRDVGLLDVGEEVAIVGRLNTDFGHLQV